MLCKIKYVELVFCFLDLLLTTFLNIWLALKRAVEFVGNLSTVGTVPHGPLPD